MAAHSLRTDHRPPYESDGMTCDAGKEILSAMDPAYNQFVHHENKAVP
ncbi:hypothetical protein [Planococcus salinus]|nr:hypothetical protein [Planococcus salinus]